MRLTVTIDAQPRSKRLVIPAGMTSPYHRVRHDGLHGATAIGLLNDAMLALDAWVIEADGGPVQIDYRVDRMEAEGSYPEPAFLPRLNRYTRAARELADASQRLARAAGGGLAGVQALVTEAEERFAYTHPDRRFNDGLGEVPYLSCGLTPGSCVDINTYLVASLRAAGYEAAYLSGYFFPAERSGVTNDMHCWVVSRCDGVVQEWDIAHHMKADLGPTRPGLNPRPGRRVALGHSMGHCYSGFEHGYSLKLLAEPLLYGFDSDEGKVPITARLQDENAEVAMDRRGDLAPAGR